MEILIKAGADLFAKNPNDFTPLHMACKYRRLDVVEFLLSKWAIIDETTTEKQWTPLLLATYPTKHDTGMKYCKRHEALLKLLARGANVQATSDGQTILHNAARAGNTELTRVVIEHGVDVCAATLDGKNGLAFSW
jgi:ankyrin repeat protein